MNIVLHGWCNLCGAQDLFYARPVDSESLFFVCAACGHGCPTPDGDYTSVDDVAAMVAPNGWMLAVSADVPNAESAGTILDTQKSNEYQSLIAHYSGLTLRGPVA